MYLCIYISFSLHTHIYTHLHTHIHLYINYVGVYFTSKVQRQILKVGDRFQSLLVSHLHLHKVKNLEAFGSLVQDDSFRQRKLKSILAQYIYIYIYILPYPRKVEFSGEEVIVLPLAFIASLFIHELRSRQPLNGCMLTIVIVIHNHLKFTSQQMAPRG